MLYSYLLYNKHYLTIRAVYTLLYEEERKQT